MDKASILSLAYKVALVVAMWALIIFNIERRTIEKIVTIAIMGTILALIIFIVYALSIEFWAWIQ